MSLSTSYLTSTKNLNAIFDAIRGAKAPPKFTTRFLESLDFKSAADRLIIGVLKSLKFLDEEARPKERYFRFLDQTQSAYVLAEAIEETYSDLFQVNNSAQNLPKQQLVNKLKTLTQGQLSESVLDKMAMTFVSLVKLADFEKRPLSSSTSNSNPAISHQENSDQTPETPKDHIPLMRPPSNRTLGGLHYNIQIILPETRDPKVYDALFRSLKEHLLHD